MAQLASSFFQACCKGFNERHLRSAISFEVERGFRNTFGRTMRFSNFLQLKLQRWCSRSSHGSAKKLLEEVSRYDTASLSERANFLNKISVLMEYGSTQDLIEQERIRRESGADAKGMIEEFDFSLICGRFPSIILGDSSLVELYEEVQHTEVEASYLSSEKTSEYLAASGGKWSEPIPHRIRYGTTTDEKLAETAIVEALDSLVCPLSDTNSHPIKEDNSSVIFSVQEVDSNGLKEKLDAEGTNEKSSETMLLTESGLDKTIRSINGLSRKQYCQLENNGFYTVRKLLQHFPRTYADLRNAHEAIYDGCYVMFAGTIKSSKGIRATSSLSFHEVIVACEFLKNEQTSEISNEDNGTEEKKIVHLHLKTFFRGKRFTSQPFLKNIQSKYNEGDLVYASGKVRKMHMQDHYEMREYSIDMLQGEEELDAHIDRRTYPIYPCKAGLKSSFFAQIIKRALKMLNVNMDPMPDDILKEFNLLNLYDAYVGIHNPKNLNEADLARRRLIFDDFFYLQLGRLFQMLDALGTQMEKEELLDKYKNHERRSIRIEEWSNLTKRFLDALPYNLTPSQQNAVSEIIWDLKRPVPMNRLLQGDVGCGKTVVAFLICMEVIGSGFQAAFMVPTELLAIQHYENLLALLDDIGGDVCKPSIALLTGSTSSRESRTILKGLQTGEIAMVIGTHSLIAEKIEFSALRIAVVDEQHRFGVIQRGRFTSKLYSASSSLTLSGKDSNWSAEDKSYMAPHILAISATPIPRTLALALYGDMSLTQITDLPPGRMPIETFVLEGDAKGFKKVFQMMRDELMEGGKIYLVYPVIEESEQLPQLHAAVADVPSISKKFDGYPCGLLHGRMKSDEKDDTLKKFRSGEFRILLATHVIEIGVDVPDASMMVVMNAERFGIAQLHQLRGRVGRGEKKSKCVFLSTSGTLDRLKVLEKSSNGFYLAHMDLLFRGPGNLLGKKQSGHLPEFPIARLEIDGNILQEAHVAALKVLDISNGLEVFPKLKAELSMRQPLCTLGD